MTRAESGVAPLTGLGCEELKKKKSHVYAKELKGGSLRGIGTSMFT